MVIWALKISRTVPLEHGGGQNVFVRILSLFLVTHILLFSSLLLLAVFLFHDTLFIPVF